MIISHKNKFIFIKNRKTGGSSLEVVLSKFCGKDDIITPLPFKEEQLRKEFGGLSHRNWMTPFEEYTEREWREMHNVFHRGHRMKTFIPVRYWNHCGYENIMKYVNSDIWNSYFKFCFERNPWDKTLSFFWWKHPKRVLKSEDFSIFIERGKGLTLSDWTKYADISPVVDRVFQYENIQEELRMLDECLHLNISNEMKNCPRIHGTYRSDRRYWKEIISELGLGRSTCNTMKRTFANEIKYFGYDV